VSVQEKAIKVRLQRAFQVRESDTSNGKILSKMINEKQCQHRANMAVFLPGCMEG
jgi:hypothetical protein